MLTRLEKMQCRCKAFETINEYIQQMILSEQSNKEYYDGINECKADYHTEMYNLYEEIYKLLESNF